MFGWFCIQVQARSKSYVLANLLITLTFHECLNMIHIIESLTPPIIVTNTPHLPNHTHIHASWSFLYVCFSTLQHLV